MSHTTRAPAPAPGPEADPPWAAVPARDARADRSFGDAVRRDLSCGHVIPLQGVVPPSAPGGDVDGGEFVVMTRQRPRRQSRPMALALRRGDAAVIAVRHRPVQGTRGVVRVPRRHGVGRVHSGRWHALGVIFHDAA